MTIIHLSLSLVLSNLLFLEQVLDARRGAVALPGAKLGTAF